MLPGTEHQLPSAQGVKSSIKSCLLAHLCSLIHFSSQNQQSARSTFPLNLFGKETLHRKIVCFEKGVTVRVVLEVVAHACGRGLGYPDLRSANLVSSCKVIEITSCTLEGRNNFTSYLSSRFNPPRKTTFKKNRSQILSSISQSSKLSNIVTEGT